MTYRAQSPILGLSLKETGSRRLVVPIPVGTDFRLVGASTDKRFVVVEINRESVEIFASDLSSHCRAIDEQTGPDQPGLPG